MSTFTQTLNRSTSVVTDVAVSIGVGLVAGVAADWLQLDALPIAGKYVPFVVAAVAGAAVYMRQRSNLRKAPPAEMIS